MTEGETNSSVIYVVDLEGEVHRLDLPGGDVTRTLLPEPWTPDGTTLLYLAGGDIQAADAAGGLSRTVVDFGATSPGYTPQQYFNGPDPVLSPDGSRLAYIRESELWVLDLKDGGVRQLTSSHGEGWHNLQPRWSPDGARILYTAQATDEQRRFRYTDFSGLIIGVHFTLIGYGRVRLGVIPAEGGETTWLGPPDGERYSLRGGSQAHWSPDGRSVAINRLSLDHKAREIRIASPETGEVRTIWREEVEAWISPLAIWIRWSPDSRQLLFTSERDDWNHVHVIDADGADPEPMQLTSGDFTVTSNQVYDRFEVTPVWSRGGRTILFPSNEAGTPERHLYEVPVAGGEWRRVTPLPGVNLSSTPSPDGSRVAYLYSNLTALPELYVQEIDADQPRRLTSLAVPERLAGYRFREPEIVRFPSAADGAAVTARVYRPDGLDPARRYPAVVFVHGAGYAQSVFAGWMRLDQSAFIGTWRKKGTWSSTWTSAEAPATAASSGWMSSTALETSMWPTCWAASSICAAWATWTWNGSGRGGTATEGSWWPARCCGHPRPSRRACPAPRDRLGALLLSGPGIQRGALRLPLGKPGRHPAWFPDHLCGKPRASHAHPERIQDTMHLDAAALVNELLAHGRTTFEWIFYPDEAHGIRGPRARSDYYRRIAEYLDRYLKAGPAAASDR